MQAGQVVAFDCGNPRGQALVVAVGHHLGEGGDVAGGGVQLRAAGLDLCQLGCLVLGEVARELSVRTMIFDVEPLSALLGARENLIHPGSSRGAEEPLC